MSTQDRLTGALGWIGSARELAYALDVFGAQKDEQGRVILTGSPPTSFMGVGGPDAEVAVPASCMCFVNGRETSVAGLLGQTSYGLRVHVI